MFCTQRNRFPPRERMSEIPFYSITWCKLTYKLMLIQNETFSYCIWNQQSEYKVFDKLQGWLWAKPVDVLVWCGPLLRDLVRRITGQLTNVVSVFLRRYPMEWGRVRGSSEFLVLYGAWHFWRGWLLAQMKYLGLRGSQHWWRTVGCEQLLVVF